MALSIKIKIIAAVLVAVLLAGGGCGLYIKYLWADIKSLQADNQRLELTAQVAQAEAEQARQEAEDGRRAVVVSRAIIALQNAETAALNVKLEEFYASEQTNQDWVDNPCPVGLDDCLWPQMPAQ